MNLYGGKFQPSRELLAREAKMKVADSANATREAVVTPATKAVVQKERADELSVEEVAAMKADSADESQELARLYLNGELCCIGKKWLPGMREKWDAR